MIISKCKACLNKAYITYKDGASDVPVHTGHREERYLRPEPAVHGSLPVVGGRPGAVALVEVLTHPPP